MKKVFLIASITLGVMAFANSAAFAACKDGEYKKVEGKECTHKHDASKEHKDCTHEDCDCKKGDHASHEVKGKLAEETDAMSAMVEGVEPSNHEVTSRLAEESDAMSAMAEGVDHSKMDHSKMDHGSMDHSKMDHSMDHGDMDHGDHDHAPEAPTEAHLDIGKLDAANLADVAAGRAINVKVNGLVCDFCARAVKKVFKKNEAIKDVEVNLDTKVITLDLNEGGEISDDEIGKAIKNAGYKLVSITRGGV